jgi:hypothetical protein
MGGTDAEDRASSGRIGQFRRTSRLPPAPRADTKAGSPRADRAPCRLGADQANPAVASTAPDSAKIIAERIFTIGRPGAVPENWRVVMEVYAKLSRHASSSRSVRLPTVPIAALPVLARSTKNICPVGSLARCADVRPRTSTGDREMSNATAQTAASPLYPSARRA